MRDNIEKILKFATQLSLEIVYQDTKAELIVVSNEDKGIYQMVIDCEYPILVYEQIIYDIRNFTKEHFLRLLQMNRNLIQGAFVIDDQAKHLLFRDTLQLENLDFNEFEGSINSLSFGLAEYSRELIKMNQASD